MRTNWLRSIPRHILEQAAHAMRRAVSGVAVRLPARNVELPRSNGQIGPANRKAHQTADIAASCPQPVGARRT